MGAPLLLTTTVFEFTASTLAINSSCSPGKLKVSRSLPSVSQSSLVPTIKIHASDVLARRTASPIGSANWGAKIPYRSPLNIVSALTWYSMATRIRRPASRNRVARTSVDPCMKKASPGSGAVQLSITASSSTHIRARPVDSKPKV